MLFISRVDATAGRSYIPAAGRMGLTGLYDAAIALTMRERRFRGALLEGLFAGSDERGLDVLDVGTGTGTLAIAMAARGARVVALDVDPDVLARARAKPGAELVRWQEGHAGQLPVADGSVDRVVCSLVLHHLPDELKRTTLGEALRVLRGGGRLHVADWGAPRDAAMRAAFRLLQAVDGRSSTQSHADGLIPGFIAAAGFADVSVSGRLRTMWGQLELMSATKSDRAFGARCSPN